jgi:hypothetical protein
VQLQAVDAETDGVKIWHRYVSFLQTLSTMALTALRRLHDTSDGRSPILVRATILPAYRFGDVGRGLGLG